jgi:Flp pilus assembly protein TadG
MKMMPMSSIWLRGRLFTAALVADCRAVAATEFAVVLPMMLMLFFGTVEFSNGVAIDRKVTLVARTLSDLTSRATSVADTDLTNFFAAGTGVMYPYSASLLNSTITELWIDPSSSQARVQWSKGAAPRGQGTSVAIPSNLIATDSTGKAVPNQYLIYSEVNYKYMPAVVWFLKSGLTLSDYTYTRPRQSTCVVYPTPASGVPLPPCPTA